MSDVKKRAEQWLQAESCSPYRLANDEQLVRGLLDRVSEQAQQIATIQQHMQEFDASLRAEFPEARLSSGFGIPTAKMVIRSLKAQAAALTQEIVGQQQELDRVGALEAMSRERADAVEQEREEAYGYLSRLFTSCAPQCEPLPTLPGLATQLDNYIAGLRELAEAAEARASEEIGNREKSQIYASQCQEATASMALKLAADEAQVAALTAAMAEDQAVERAALERARATKACIGVVVAQLRAHAAEIEADGDYCCALTRRHDADALEAVLAGAVSTAKQEEAQVAASQWQPIETAPKDGSHIIAWLDVQRVAVIQWALMLGRPRWYEPGWGGCTPTHWQPLPAPPDGAMKSPCRFVDARCVVCGEPESGMCNSGGPDGAMK